MWLSFYFGARCALFIFESISRTAISSPFDVQKIDVKETNIRASLSRSHLKIEAFKVIFLLSKVIFEI